MTLSTVIEALPVSSNSMVNAGSQLNWHPTSDNWALSEMLLKRNIKLKVAIRNRRLKNFEKLSGRNLFSVANLQVQNIWTVSGRCTLYMAPLGLAPLMKLGGPGDPERTGNPTGTPWLCIMISETPAYAHIQKRRSDFFFKIVHGIKSSARPCEVKVLGLQRWRK